MALVSWPVILRHTLMASPEPVQGMRGQGKGRGLGSSPQLWPACVLAVFLSQHPPEVSGPGKPGLQWSMVDPGLNEHLQESARGADKLMTERLAGSHTSTREGDKLNTSFPSPFQLAAASGPALASGIDWTGKCVFSYRGERTRMKSVTL